ncbi:hypothetical protein TNCV_1045611 [Trichonephila clavipes]|nr:hypothetical protein TNCV_1045611 [Trichonephila clavipes]
MNIQLKKWSVCWPCNEAHGNKITPIKTANLVRWTDMLQNNLDLPSHTISDWKQFVHEVILDHVEENSEQIGGIDCIVQIDESILEKKKI